MRSASKTVKSKVYVEHIGEDDGDSIAIFTDHQGVFVIEKNENEQSFKKILHQAKETKTLLEIEYDARLNIKNISQ